ncbi:MAG: hypothetical protein BWY75_01107 [bacterium ADurb.Bin425]|nr:MAG: hypothetical protein BWY75_01107 [bacterium ADurb.Bin425]
MAKPTARDSGIKSSRVMPTIKKEGRKTETTDNIANKRGTMVSTQASKTARAFTAPSARWLCIFSIQTVASSTKIPIDRARPLRV